MSNKEEETLTGSTVVKGEGCPYAAALHSDESVSSSDTLLLSCPAFQKGACPFASCQNDEEIRKMLLQIPSSHYEDTEKDPIGTQFLRVLQELHSVAPSVSGTGSIAQCPVAKMPTLQKKLSSFTEAIEGQSLAEIMARMAQEEEHQSQLGKGGGGPLEVEQENSTSVKVAVTSEPLSVEQNEAPVEHSQETQTTSLLSETIKRGTAESYTAAENVHFVKNFIRGQVDRVLFAELVQKLYYVYRVLEELLLQHQDHPALRPFSEFHVALQRTDALLEDLDFWFGPKEAERMAQGINAHPSPATQDYLDRLQHCAEHQPELLLAHSYTRYLGDLSGGAILARVARKALQLSGSGDGLAFYDFSATISHPKAFKDQYRRALDAYTADAPVEALVHEANVAFGLNMRLFEELDVQAGVPGAAVRPLAAILTPPHRTLAATEAAAECPFANIAKDANKASKTGKAGGGCPWPFVLLHDPVRGLCDWRSWAVLGVVLALLWRHYVAMPST